MMNCSGFREDIHRHDEGEKSVNNKPVVIAPWSLSERVFFRSGSYTPRGYNPWDSAGPGKRMKKS